MYSQFRRSICRHMRPLIFKWTVAYFERHRTLRGGNRWRSTTWIEYFGINTACHSHCLDTTVQVNHSENILKMRRVAHWRIQSKGISAKQSPQTAKVTDCLSSKAAQDNCKYLYLRYICSSYTHIFSIDVEMQTTIWTSLYSHSVVCLEIVEWISQHYILFKILLLIISSAHSHEKRNAYVPLIFLSWVRSFPLSWCRFSEFLPQTWSRLS